jgi:hypothetical protein
LFDRILYIVYNIKLLYSNTIYNIQIYYIILYYIQIQIQCIIQIQCEVDFLSQFFTSIFSIHLFLDNDYGTIISFKLVLLIEYEHVKNYK